MYSPADLTLERIGDLVNYGLPAALAAQLQEEGAQSFDKSWNELMDTIASKSHVLGKTIQTGGKR